MMKKKKEDQATDDGDDEGFESSPEKVSLSSQFKIIARLPLIV